jgi:hypothetical protein
MELEILFATNMTTVFIVGKKVSDLRLDLYFINLEVPP